jgi:hypothetical protein
MVMTVDDDESDERFSAFLAAGRLVAGGYALWQVSLQTYPAATMTTEWRDYNTEDNISLETNLQNHSDGCRIVTTEIDPHTELRHGDWFINYDTMQQTNSMTGTVRLVRRVMVTRQSEPM